jgi:heterodisulfide reductase subunit A
MKKSGKINSFEENICIFGGGVLGLNLAIQLADLGFHVFLIEESEFFGGHAAHLYKAFPTDDCFFCLLSTNLKAGIRKCFYRSGINFHPNITLLKNTELIQLDGEVGNFKLELKRNPSYINENCTKCAKCIEECPRIEDLNQIYDPDSDSPIISYNYPQCISHYVIDRSKCDSECTKCKDICPFNAIDLNEKEKKFDLTCSKIIIASGFQEFDPSIIKNYKYGVYPDVITQDELATMLDPDGITNGELIRPSNREPVNTLVMLQCVGSRDENYNRYCSGLCCNYAIKHAKIIKDNIQNAPEIFIVYIDIRTMGFLENYYTTARDKDIKFIKGNLTDVEFIYNEKSGTEKLNLKVYDVLLNSILIINSDLLVLSPAIIPSESGIALCKKIGLELNEEGFIKTREDFLSTNIEGVYACGSITHPVDLAYSSTLSKKMVFKIYHDYLSGRNHR